MFEQEMRCFFGIIRFLEHLKGIILMCRLSGSGRRCLSFSSCSSSGGLGCGFLMMFDFNHRKNQVRS